MTQSHRLTENLQLLSNYCKYDFNTEHSDFPSLVTTVIPGLSFLNCFVHDHKAGVKLRYFFS